MRRVIYGQEFFGKDDLDLTRVRCAIECRASRAATETWRRGKYHGKVVSSDDLRQAALITRKLLDSAGN